MEMRREQDRRIAEQHREGMPAVEAYERPVHNGLPGEHADVRPPVGLRVRWAGVTSGWVMALGTILLLTALGLAIGLTSIGDPRTGVPTTGLGRGAGMWGGITLLIAFFLGGMISTRVTDRPDRGGAVIHGMLVWTLTSVFLIWLLGQGISFGLSNLFGALGGITRTVATSAVNAATTGGGDTLISTLGLNDSAQVLARLNDPQTARLFATATGMTTEQAQTALGQLRSRLEPLQNNPEQMTTEVRNFLASYGPQIEQQALKAAATAQQTAETGSWITFGVLALTLIASLLGALAGIPSLRNWRSRLAHTGAA